MRKLFSNLRRFVQRPEPPVSSPAITSQSPPTGKHPGSSGTTNGEWESELAGQHLDPLGEAPRSSGPRATLEALPAELRSQILLCLSNLEDLDAVVHASPILHQQYLADRKKLLAKHLRTTLGDQVFVDAYAVQTSTSFRQPHHTLSKQAIRQFVNTYQDFRLAPDAILDECNVEDLVGMAGFYSSIIRPLSQEFSELLLRNLNDSLKVGSLSETERVRFMRALYRFQMWCNLFGVGNDAHPTYCTVEPIEMLRLLFGIFNPWETEEVSCIYALLSNKYEQLFDDIKWDLNRNNPRFSDWVYLHTPDGSFDLDNLIYREFLRDGVLSRGLEFYRSAMKISDHEKLVQTMQDMMTGGPRTIAEALSYITQDSRRIQHPSDRDRAERVREKLLFSGDKEDEPPLAWVIMWKGTYSNTYGEIIPESMKSWGYVFWDGKRLVRSGAKDVLMRTWVAKYPRDPRY